MVNLDHLIAKEKEFKLGDKIIKVQEPTLKQMLRLINLSRSAGENIESLGGIVDILKELGVDENLTAKQTMAVMAELMPQEEKKSPLVTETSPTS